MKFPSLTKKAPEPDPINRDYRRSNAIHFLELEIHAVAKQIGQEIQAAMESSADPRESFDAMKSSAMAGYFRIPSNRKQMAQIADSFLAGMLSADKEDLLNGVRHWHAVLEHVRDQLELEIEEGLPNL